jgi:hypothetical protein
MIISYANPYHGIFSRKGRKIVEILFLAKAPSMEMQPPQRKTSLIPYGLCSMAVAREASPFDKEGLRGIFIKSNLPLPLFTKEAFSRKINPP